MVNGIRKIYLYGLREGFSSKFCVGSWFRHDTPEESQRVYRPKLSEYNNEDENNTPNILSNKNYQASS